MFHKGSVSLLHSSSVTIFFSHFCQDSELTELKDTIDILKAKNTEAQEIIQGALSSPDIAPQGEKQTNSRHDGRVRTSILTVKFPLLLSLSVLKKCPSTARTRRKVSPAWPVWSATQAWPVSKSRRPRRRRRRAG